jgi:hypothetical protein
MGDLGSQLTEAANQDELAKVRSWFSGSLRCEGAAG